MTETLPLVKTAEVEFTQPHAVYRLYDSAGVLLYVGFTRNLGARMAKHEAEQPWWPLVARKTMVWYGTEYAARAAEAIAIAEEDPVHNVVRPAVGDKVPPHGQRKGWNRTPLIAWHPTDPTLKPWLESHAKRIGVNLRELLDRMAADYRTKHDTEETDR